MFDGLYPPGLQWYWKADFVNELSDEAIALHIEHGSRIPTLLSTAHLYPINGKANQVASTETPWSYRDAVWAEVIVGVDPEPANRERITAWAKNYWDALHPYSAGGAYLNFIMDEGEDRGGQATVKTTNGWSRSRTNTIPRTCFASIRISNPPCDRSPCEEHSGALGRGVPELFEASDQSRVSTRLRASFPSVPQPWVFGQAPDRFGQLAASRALVIKPSLPCCTRSLGPPTSETMTGSPLACASRTTLPKVSVVLGKTKKSAEA